MSKSILKKEFKHSDVERVRNLVKKNYTGKTKLQTGYQKAYTKHQEGDIWEESGKTWTIKNGIKQNITKFDKAKKAIRIPLACPKCKGSMNYHLSKKMYKIHGMCFDCTIDYEAQLRKAGLYDEYEKNLMQGNIKTFLSEIESYTHSLINNEQSYVTEQGVVEDWKNNSNIQKNKLLQNLQTYIEIVSKHLD